MSGLKTPIALAAVVALATASLAAGAAEGPAAPEQAAVGASADAQVVARDPATGKLRAATAEEVQLLHRARAAQLRGASPTSATHQHWSGARGARLTDEFMSYSVVVRTADGKLVEVCVEDPSLTAAKPTEAKSSTLPTE